MVVAFSQNTEGDFLQKTLEEHLPRAASGGLLDPQHGKLVVAQSSQSPPGRGCRWVRLDHATFEATGECSSRASHTLSEYGSELKCFIEWVRSLLFVA